MKSKIKTIKSKIVLFFLNMLLSEDCGRKRCNLWRRILNGDWDGPLQIWRCKFLLDLTFNTIYLYGECDITNLQRKCLNMYNTILRSSVDITLKLVGKNSTLKLNLLCRPTFFNFSIFLFKMNALPPHRTLSQVPTYMSAFANFSLPKIPLLWAWDVKEKGIKLEWFEGIVCR